MNLPASIREYTSLNDLCVDEILQKNNRKKTYVVKVHDDKRCYILKAISDDSPVETKRNFYKEIRFYKNNKIDFIKDIHKCSNYIIQIEFIEGKLLRDFLITSCQNNELIKSLFDNAISLYKHIDIAERGDFSNAYTNLGRLVLSGPRQAQGIKFTLQDKIIKKILWIFLRLKLNNSLNKLKTYKLRYGFSHGDLHYNNIIVSNSKELWFFDFENIKYEGFYDFDLLYLFVMVEVFLDDQKYRSIKTDIIDRICEKESELLEILKIYRFAIWTNVKFQKYFKSTYSKPRLIKKMFFFDK